MRNWSRKVGRRIANLGSSRNRGRNKVCDLTHYSISNIINMIKTSSSTKHFSFVLHVGYCFCKCFLEYLVYIFTVTSWTREILKSSFLCISYGLGLFYLFTSTIIFVTYEYKNWVFEVDSIGFHDGLPFSQSVETVTVF